MKTTISLSQAYNAASIFDSFGVGTHWNYTDKVYSSRYQELKQLLIDSGIRHVRGDISRAADLLAAGNILTTTSGYDEATPSQVVTKLQDVVYALGGIEGPNEPDLFWLNRSYRGLTGPSAAYLWQQDLWTAVRANPKFDNVPVIGPALGKPYFGGGNPFAPDSLYSYVDKGNFHPYPRPNTFTPSTVTYAGISAYYYNSTFPTTCLDQYPKFFTAQKPPYSSKPMFATETGYPTWSGGQTEQTQGKYLARLFLEYFRLGIQRTFWYELINQGVDDSRESKFGLLRNDLSAKPAWNALKTLIRLYKDSLDSAFGLAQPITASITVDPPPGYSASYVHTLVARKTNGQIIIAVWHEVTAENLSLPAGSREITVTPIPASITLPQSKLIRIETMNPFSGSLGIPSYCAINTTATFNVTDTVTFITLT